MINPKTKIKKGKTSLAKQYFWKKFGGEKGGMIDFGSENIDEKSILFQFQLISERIFQNNEIKNKELESELYKENFELEIFGKIIN